MITCPGCGSTTSRDYPSIQKGLMRCDECRTQWCDRCGSIHIKRLPSFICEAYESDTFWVLAWCDDCHKIFSLE